MLSEKDKKYAGTLIDGARMYAAAADATNDKYPNALHVISHLLGMSAELALKAYLVNNGITEKELKKVGHDLRLLYEKARGYGLYYTGSRNFRLSVLSANYQARIFVYPKEGELVVINPRNLRETIRELIMEIFKVVKGADLLDEIIDQPGIAIKSNYPEDMNVSAWAVQ